MSPQPSTRDLVEEPSSPAAETTDAETRSAAGIVPEAVVVVAGPFEGATVERWERLIGEFLSLAPRRLVVDLGACPALDAAAIAVLLRAHRAMVATGGRLTLRGPAGRSGRMLRLARVDQVFDIDKG